MSWIIGRWAGALGSPRAVFAFEASAQEEAAHRLRFRGNVHGSVLCRWTWGAPTNPEGTC